MEIKHPDPEIKAALQELYDYSRNSTEPKALKKLKVKQMRTALRNKGLLSLPFTLNTKKF